MLSTLSILLALSLTSAAGVEPSPALPHSQMYERASARFEDAVLFKPKESGTNDLTFQFAPLIIQEAKEHNVLQGDLFGSIIRARNEREIDAARPEIYVHTDSVSIGRKTHPRFTYLWFYSGEPAGSQPATRCQGVRITLDSVGNPVIWEILADDSGN